MAVCGMKVVRRGLFRPALFVSAGLLGSLSPCCLLPHSLPPRTMSIKLTTQMDWVKYASYSKYHPDNLARPDNNVLPSQVRGPPPINQITELDKAQ